MLEQVDALPCAKTKTAIHDRDGQADRQDRGLDVGRHVIWPFRAVTDPTHGRVSCMRGKPLEELMKIRLHRGVGIFLDQKRTRGVAQEERKPVRIAGKGMQMLGELIETGAICLDREGLSHERPGAGDCKGRERPLP